MCFLEQVVEMLIFSFYVHCTNVSFSSKSLDVHTVSLFLGGPLGLLQL